MIRYTSYVLVECISYVPVTRFIEPNFFIVSDGERGEQTKRYEQSIISTRTAPNIVCDHAAQFPLRNDVYMNLIQISVKI